MKSRMTRKQYKRRQKTRRFFRVSFFTIIGIGIMLIGLKTLNWWLEYKNNPMNQYEEDDFVLSGTELENGVQVDVQLITENKYSRPGTKLKKINGVVIHYVGNPGTTAQNNRDYFDSLAEKQDRYASSHFVVGLDGEVIQCIPLNEIAYASNERNSDTISIEVCHPDEDGKFNSETYESVVDLTADLCQMFGLDSDDVIRHYDVTGKLCPLYYVEHEDAWTELKGNVQDVLDDLQSESN